MGNAWETRRGKKGRVQSHRRMPTPPPPRVSRVPTKLLPQAHLPEPLGVVHWKLGVESEDSRRVSAMRPRRWY